jgi:hypothetical protein
MRFRSEFNCPDIGRAPADEVADGEEIRCIWPHRTLTQPDQLSAGGKSDCFHVWGFRLFSDASPERFCVKREHAVRTACVRLESAKSQPVDITYDLDFFR